MITQAQIDEIVAAAGDGPPVLSVYLDLSPERQATHAYESAFSSLAQALGPRVPAAWQDTFAADVARVREFVSRPITGGTGFAIFSSIERGLWRALPLPVTVADAVSYDAVPRLRPLLDIADELERTALALVDKERGRLLTIRLGRIEAERDIVDAVPGRHMQGGWEQARRQRHHDNAVMHHIENVVGQLEQLQARYPFKRLFVLGPPEATAELERRISNSLRQRLAGVAPGEFFASDQQLLARARELAANRERADEAELVDRLLERAGAGGRGALGVDPTLDAVRLGQVDTLVVTLDAATAGVACQSCGTLSRSTTTTCDWCGGELTPVEDVVERAVVRTLHQSGSVEIVHGEAAARLREAGEGVGALLRYTAVGV